MTLADTLSGGCRSRSEWRSERDSNPRGSLHHLPHFQCGALGQLGDRSSAIVSAAVGLPDQQSCRVSARQQAGYLPCSNSIASGGTPRHVRSARLPSVHGLAVRARLRPARPLVDRFYLPDLLADRARLPATRRSLVLLVRRGCSSLARILDAPGEVSE